MVESGMPAMRARMVAAAMGKLCPVNLDEGAVGSTLLILAALE